MLFFIDFYIYKCNKKYFNVQFVMVFIIMSVVWCIKHTIEILNIQ